MTDDTKLGLSADPYESFARWYAEAEAAVPQAEAMALASVDDRGRPAVRMVLYRELNAGGLTFFTNYKSSKGKELANNPQAALLFFWQPLGRQVRVEGRVDRIDAESSSDYFATRERESQLGAWASRQSAPLGSREELLAELEATRERFAGGEVPRPEFWGGYCLVPDRFEFWQHQDSRLHDRFAYDLMAEGGEGGPSGWRMTRLAP